MDNENKELEELETQDIESVTETESVEAPDEVVEDAEFDPTESDDFYNNLEAAIGGDEEFGDAEIPELSLPEDTFVLDDDTVQPEEESFDAEIFAGVNAALSEQIEQEFGADPEESVTEEEAPNRFVAGWRAIPTWSKVLAGVILALLISVGLLFGTARGRELLIDIAVEWAFGKVNVEPTTTPELTVTVAPDPTEEPTPLPTETPTPAPTVDPNQNPDATPEPTADPEITPDVTPEATLSPTPTPWPVAKLMDDENIINVLLLGEENLYKANRGRTDAMILVSINLNGGPLKMISFQRDLYVNIPGKAPNRINAAYGKGGYKCVVDTIEQNFGVDIDGYAKVDFKGFENLIDSLGGLRISLTAKESEYLNTTRYISKPSERNTVAGYQDMTGAQVLGYCRVRFVKTAEGLSGDRGRNYRHRVVLQALFEKFKDQNITQLSKLIDQCAEHVTVSANLKELCKKGLVAVVENKMYEIDTMQFPQSGQYENKIVQDEFGNDMDIVMNYPGAVEKLQKYIYGDN